MECLVQWHNGRSRPSDKGGGGRSSRPWNKGGWSKNNFFSALQASVWSKNKGGAGSPGPFPGSTTVVFISQVYLYIYQLLYLTSHLSPLEIKHFDLMAAYAWRPFSHTSWWRCLSWSIALTYTFFQNHNEKRKVHIIFQKSLILECLWKFLDVLDMLRSCTKIMVLMITNPHLWLKKVYKCILKLLVQVKIKFRLNFFNLRGYSIFFVSLQ